MYIVYIKFKFLHIHHLYIYKVTIYDRQPVTVYQILQRQIFVWGGRGINIWGGPAACFGQGMVAMPRRTKEKV